MKTLRLTCVTLALLFGYTAFAQNTVNLEIKHMMNHEDLIFGELGYTVDKAPFSITRLQYYFSQVSITHDGGQTTDLDSIWVLVNTNGPTNIDLGSQAITSVESVSFYIGVESSVNHLNPTIWPSGHPLALKSPSMHWGWASGYRFVAMEGKVGSELFQGYEVHSLGDMNYFQITVNATGTAQNGELDLTIYGNYAEALRGVDISSGFAVHGEDDESLDLLINFRDYVFSANVPDTLIGDTTGTTGITEIYSAANVVVAPNPVVDGSANIWFQEGSVSSFEARLFDVTGKQVSITTNSFQDHLQIIGLQKGFYILQLQDRASNLVISRKVSVL